MKKKIDKNKVFWFIVILILVIVVFLMLFQSRYSIKKGQADNVLPSQIPTDLVEMTKTIIDAKEIYENASETEKPEIVSNLINIAEERQNKIYELLEEKNITEAKKQILDYDLISEIPEELKEFIEEPIDIEGTIEINHADYFEEGYFEEESFVITDKQESFKLRSIEDYEFLPKTSVRIKGVQVKDILLIDEDDESVDILDEPDNFNLPAQTNSTPTTIDSRKVAVILLNFANVQDDPPLTHEQVREIVFTGPLSANAYIKDVSFNQVEFIGDINTNGDVFGYYTLPYDNYPCKKAEWANKANQLATVNGFRYNNYDYVLYVVRSSTSCPGKASAAVLDKKSWYEELKSGYVNHELGHNFGLSHASLYRCKSGDEYVTLSESCTYKEYGDVFDTMGSSTGRRHFNAFFKTGFGNTQFIPYQNMITVTQTGTYTISSIENPTTNPQLLKIYRPNYPNLQKRQIYVDYREPHDVFDNYSTTSPAVNGIMIRLGPENNVYEKTYLLDAVPSTETANDAPFLVNQTFTDPYTGIQITLMEKTKSTATVYVDLNDNYQECVKYKPHAYFSLPRSLVGVAGNTFSYNLNVLNKNNSMCSNSDFNFNFNLPTGFTTTPIPTRSFYPGEMVTIPVQITTDPSLEGRYEFNVLVTDMSSGLSYTTFDASITLSMPSCTRKKPVVTITPKSQAGNLGDTLTYNLNVTNRDVSVCSTSDFLISASSLPSGFTITPIPEISIIPGSSVSIPVQITSGSSLVAGDYDFNISVKNKFSGLSETVIGTYQVSSTTYTLKYTSGSGGTLSGTTTQTVVKGGNGTPVTAIPNSSYHFVKWSDNSTQNPRTDTNVNNNITVQATFAKNPLTTYTLKYTSGSGGTLSGTTTQTVVKGGNGTPVTAIPNSSYHFVKWSDNSTQNPRTDTNVNNNITVQATFAKNPLTTYTLKYTSGSGGTLSGTTTQTVVKGGNGTSVTANPNSGYHFVKWSDNSTQNPRTDTNVNNNITVQATFAKNPLTTYTLKYTSGSGGTLSGTTTQTVVKGGNGTPVTAIPNSSYHFVKWSDNSTQNPRTDTNVNNNITVVAKFEESKSSPPSGGGSGPTKSYPIVTNNSITTNIEIPSPENVQEILEDNNLSYDDINLEKYTLNNRNQYEIKRKLETTKTVLSSKKTEFLSKITLSVKNISDKNLTNLKVIEIIPKVIANSTSDINSTISFNVIKEDPIIEFDLSTLSSENTTEFTYSVNRQVTESQLNLIKTIISSGETNEELLESDENAHVSEDQNTEEIPEEKIEKIEESENSEEAETKNKKDSGWFIYLIIGLVVCIVIIILVFVFQRRKKDVINNPLQPEVVENPSSDMASQPEVTDNQSEVASQSEMIDNQPKIYNNENWSFFKTDEKTDKEN